ncbi:MAG: T9SS C-terminal target domain-containing protein, partial [Planctomycetaceae bacterium]
DRFVIRTTKPYRSGDTIIFATDRILSVNSREERRPTAVLLHQNYPNPFNPSTMIEFEIPQRTHVSLKVFDIIGREVATLVNETLSAGYYRRPFHARSSRGEELASGIYFYRLQAGDNVQTRKFVLVR